jgi:hypothetical protein
MQALESRLHSTSYICFLSGGSQSRVPLKAMVCGEPLALSVIVIVAGRAPVVVGEKWPWMVQLAPAARLEPQLLAKA